MAELPRVNSDFLADVHRHVTEARERGAPPIESLGGAWLILGEQLMKLRIELDQPAGQRSVALARKQLVAIAGTAWKASLDLGIESAGDAVLKDIPF